MRPVEIDHPSFDAMFSARRSRERTVGCGPEETPAGRDWILPRVSTEPHVLDSRCAEDWGSPLASYVDEILVSNHSTLVAVLGATGQLA